MKQMTWMLQQVQGNDKNPLFSITKQQHFQ